MTAILLALGSAILLGGGLVLTQFGLRTVHPLSGAAISVPSFTAVFVLISPLLLHGQTVEWRAVPIFVAVGLVFGVDEHRMVRTSVVIRNASITELRFRSQNFDWQPDQLSLVTFNLTSHLPAELQTER